MKLWSWIVLLVLSSVFLGCTSAKKESKKVIGKTTILQTIVIKQPVYDGSYGKTRIKLSFVSETGKLKSFDWEGIWHCLGYITSRNSFLMVGEFQVGAWLPLTKIKYLSENDLKISDSKYKHNYLEGQKDQLSWEGFAAVPDDNLKYVAFIGSLNDEHMRLMVLNTEKDEMKVIGDPPAPPPITDPYWQKEALRQSKGEWRWGESCVDGYVEMDNGIITFKNNVLYASYGKDTVLKRSEKRNIKSWNLKF